MAMTPNGAELPCRNPNCRSVNTIHPNCRCHGQAADVGRPSGNTVSGPSGPAKASAGSRAGMAEGGVVGHYCDSGAAHQEGCEYFFKGAECAEKNHLSLADGGTVRNPKVTKHAHEYMTSKGMPPSKSTYHPVDIARGRAIAKAFEQMPHAPHDPKVKAAYDALIGETLDQFQHVKNSGLKIEKIQPGQENPYKNSSDMHKDVQNGHMWFYPTEQGFGTMTNLKDHPLMAPTSEEVDGHKMLANDVFRVVHAEGVVILGGEGDHAL